MQSRCFYNIQKITVAVAVSLMLAFMPFTVNLQNYRISLERNEAHAIAPVFAGASAFLAEMATAAGFASVGDFVATTVGITAVGTGMSLATEAGVKYGDAASDNLGNLIDAADYPDWYDLSSSEQTNWGTKENYDAAKFNSLMGAFGLEDAYGRYKTGWGNGGGGNFSFTSEEQSQLERIQQIGENWINNAPNVFGDIKNAITDLTSIKAYYGIDTNFWTVDGSKINGWPSGMPTNINISSISGWQYTANNTTYYKTFSPNVYVMKFTKSNGSQIVIPFSANSFTYYFYTNPNSMGNARSPSSGSNNGNTYYYVYFEEGTWLLTPNIPNSGTLNDASIAISAIPLILFNDVMESEELTPSVPDYPVTVIDNSTNIYYPPEGISNDTPWDDFLTYQEQITEDLSGIISLMRHIDSDLHQFNFYNNGNLKVHDEGVFTELSDIYALLMEIEGKLGNWGDISDAPDLIGDFDFDELENKVPDLLETISDLAPFGSILLLSEMYSIMANYTQIESPELIFPFDFGGFDEQNHELVIDLSWLDDIKPLINFLCIAMLIIAIANATIRIVEIEAAS